MRYGFTVDGFTVVDDEKRIGEFAFVSSPYWKQSKRYPKKTAQLMLARTWKECPDHIREPNYLWSCKQLDDAQRAALLARLGKHAVSA